VDAGRCRYNPARGIRGPMRRMRRTSVLWYCSSKVRRCTVAACPMPPARGSCPPTTDHHLGLRCIQGPLPRLFAELQSAKQLGWGLVVALCDALCVYGHIRYMYGPLACRYWPALPFFLLKAPPVAPFSSSSPPPAPAPPSFLVPPLVHLVLI
jgi:hypothetical protein